MIKYTGHKKIIILSLVIFMVALIPRIADLHGHSLTADEPGWIGRGTDFIKQIYWHHFQSATQSFERHPGVPAAVAIGFSQLFFSRALGILDPIVAARLPIACLGTLTCLSLFLLARRIWSEQIAFAAALFLALSPFHIALSRIAHQDVALSFFLMVSILTYYLGEKEKEKKWKILSAIFFGLAFLTKFTAILILIILWLWKAILKLKEQGLKIVLRPIKFFFNQLEAYWLAIGFGLFFLGYPRLWPDPVFYFLKHILSNIALGKGGHANVFMGSLTMSPPKYFYLLTTSFRMTEILIICLIIGLIVILYRLIKQRLVSKIGWLLILWFIIYFGVMSSSSKMGDRYVLPVWPILCLIGAMGLVALLNQLSQHILATKFNQRQLDWLTNLGSLVIILCLILPALIIFQPNYYLYYNSFIGGPAQAKEIIQIGWGEGHKEAFEYLLQTAGPDKTVALLGYDSTATYYYPGLILDAREENWPQADYLVLVMPHPQRYPDYSAVQYAQTHQPIQTIVLNGVEMAWVYKLSK